MPQTSSFPHEFAKKNSLIYTLKSFINGKHIFPCHTSYNFNVTFYWGSTLYLWGIWVNHREHSISNLWFMHHIGRDQALAVWPPFQHGWWCPHWYRQCHHRIWKLWTVSGFSDNSSGPVLLGGMMIWFKTWRIESRMSKQWNKTNEPFLAWTCILWAVAHKLRLYM